jgi:hypothetical protein
MSDDPPPTNLLQLVAYGDEDIYVTGDPETERLKWHRLYPRPGILKRFLGFLLSPFSGSPLGTSPRPTHREARLDAMS